MLQYSYRQHRRTNRKGAKEMTRKDYELIAKVLFNSGDLMDEVSMAFLIDNFAKELVAENPRFDRNRFATACGMTPEQVDYILTH
jgi:hypothetical protein